MRSPRRMRWRPARRPGRTGRRSWSVSSWRVRARCSPARSRPPLPSSTTACRSWPLPPPPRGGRAAGAGGGGGGEEEGGAIVAPDRPGLLWRWAGVLALHRLEIRAAMATAGGATRVAVFDVSPRFGSSPGWDRVRADVRRAYDDALPLESRLAERERAYARGVERVVPPRVLWLDDASAESTVVEVRAHDAIGLLHRLTRALADAELDVRSARVSTLGAEVVDAFYVTDRFGSPVDAPMRRTEIEARLLTACGAAGAGSPPPDPPAR